MTDGAPNSATPTPLEPLTPAEDKQWASFAHFGGILGIFPSLIIFLVFKDRGAVTRLESKEALNWQITFTVGIVLLNVAIAILTALMAFASAYTISAILGWLPFLAYAGNAILSIVGGVKVNGGENYRYPFTLRLIK